MGTSLVLQAHDDHRFTAYRADPTGAVRGGLLVVQEIFGVNAHIRHLCDDFASLGYMTLAPALFDRVEPGLELGYDSKEIERGRAIRAQIPTEHALADIKAATHHLAQTAPRVATVGYCWGGTLAWLAACQVDGLTCAVSYYGGGVPDAAAMQPKCPVLLHFGKTDTSIPLDKVERFRAAHPELPLHLYPAGHGFNCEARNSFHKESADLARRRTLDFLAAHLG